MREDGRRMARRPRGTATHQVLQRRELLVGPHKRLLLVLPLPERKQCAALVSAGSWTSVS